jgi:hypothetical protein
MSPLCEAGKIKDFQAMPKAVPAAQRRTVVGRRRKPARSDGFEKLDVRPHSFRHASGYYRAERGADPRLIQVYLATARSDTQRGTCSSARAVSRICGTTESVKSANLRMAMSRGRTPGGLQLWIDARKRHRLSHQQVQMARELGLNPKKLGKLDNHHQEPWKLPLPAFIEQLYREALRQGPPRRGALDRRPRPLGRAAASGRAPSWHVWTPR